MRRTLRLLLVVGALIGLFGQATAFAFGARTVATPAPVAAAEAMSDDCMAMMQKQQPEPARKPCKGLTFDCIAAMGCTAPFMLHDPLHPAPAASPAKLQAFWPAPAVLVGSDRPPEIHPPSILG